MPKPFLDKAAFTQNFWHSDDEFEKLKRASFSLFPQALLTLSHTFPSFLEHSVNVGTWLTAGDHFLQARKKKRRKKEKKKIKKKKKTCILRAPPLNSVKMRKRKMSKHV
jgi:hypothetical protein